MKKLPIGKQSFVAIRENKGDSIYIDKTKFIYELIENGVKTPYFLSRPRRFGKSLLVDTIKCLFEGKKELFERLFIFDKWNWEEKSPVILLSFGTLSSGSFEQIVHTVDIFIENNIEKFGLNKKNFEEIQFSSLKLAKLIKEVSKKMGKKVVFLVDEYDKPILDTIKNKELSIEVRDFLRSFYGVIKDSDEFLEFVLLTGVTKFSKVSVFSGLNNLQDITLNKKYNSICGYTYEEILENFGPEGYLEGIDLEKMKLWYNGYSFGNVSETVYNPFGILNFFGNNNEYRNYWFSSATPTFLIELIKSGKYDFSTLDLENSKTGAEILDSFDIEKIELKTLLFQSGYLTIKEIIPLGERISYILSVPNEEVRSSLNDYLIKDYLGFTNSRFNFDKLERLYGVLETGNVEGYIEIVKQVLAGIPYSNYTNNDISKYEGFYASVVYSFMAFTGIEFIAEDFTNRGRIDFTMKLKNKVYIIEFKVEKTGKNALEQIKERKYWEKYNNLEMFSENIGVQNEIYLIGMSFDEDVKNIGGFEWEKMQ